jgi:RND family efflux transporter MFP subunit
MNPPMSGPESEAAPEALGFELPPPARLSKITVGLVLTAVVGGAFALGYWPRHAAKVAPAEGAAPAAVPRVEVVTATEVASDRALTLTGSVTPLEQATLYPRISGYVRTWTADIGDKVKAGQVLAEIEAPEVDAQLAQGRAELAQARAALAQAIARQTYSTGNAARYKSLGAAEVVAKADVESSAAQADSDTASVAAAQAAIAAQQANLARLAEQQGFTRVVAPFAGTITSRTIDRGALLTAGTSTPMFTLASTDPIRILVQVPQAVAPSVTAGVAAKVSVREYAARTFPGTVTRTAGALDPALRTMTVEVRVPNPDGALLPGMFVQVALSLAVPHRVLEVPATALYNDAQGLRVATVDAGGAVHFAPIVIERDTGATIQVASGLAGTERIIKLALASLGEGDRVEVMAAPARPKPEAAKPAEGAKPGDGAKPAGR